MKSTCLVLYLSVWDLNKQAGSDSDPSQYIVEFDQHNDLVSIFTFSIKYCIGPKNRPREFDGSPHFEGF